MESNEEKKEYLWQYQKAKKEMERAEIVYDELRKSFYPSQSGGGGGSHEPKDLSALAVRLEAAEHKYLQNRYQSIEELQNIEDAIMQLESVDERNVLTRRYILNHRWEDICRELDISWTQIHRVHSKALSDFTIPNIEKCEKNKNLE